MKQKEDEAYQRGKDDGKKELLEALRNSRLSFHPNSAALQKFCKKIPSPKGRLVFIPD